MMKQYLGFKEEHPDKIVLFQVGDFYETFFEDAQVAARELEIVLTTRDTQKKNPIPMAGVPIHAVESYVNRLLSRGYKVVICNQVEAGGPEKGLFQREITRILTPGTITEPEMLEESRNNYLVTLINLSGRELNLYGLAAVDVSTGEIHLTEWPGNRFQEVADELFRLQPAECICSSRELAQMVAPYLQERETLLEVIEFSAGTDRIKKIYNGQWGEDTFEKLALFEYRAAASAGALALSYLKELKHLTAGHLRLPEIVKPGSGMEVDYITSRNLELTETIREGKKEGSLLGILDHCASAMGRRLLRRWVEHPLTDREQIGERLEAVEELYRSSLLRREIRGFLQRMIDLERFCSRLGYRRVNARDLVGLKEALLQLQPLLKLLAGFKARLLRDIRQFPDFSALINLISRALVDEPPLALQEGGLIREGYSEEADRLRSKARDGRSWLLEYEKGERERTGIKSLRIGYNRNFGYYIEVTRPNLELVPAEYRRRQTLVNAERFVTEELTEMEEEITGAREKLEQLEYRLFEELREKVAAFTPRLQAAAHRLALLDCLQNLAGVAESNHYCRPTFCDKGNLDIRGGRHPVVEQLSDQRFVPNHARMDDEKYVLLITGPNMAGKSTYIRSLALICLMGQIGSFVPAREATIPLLDRIFARVGASDDLSRGLSTFMVEMQETATILKEATPRSLIILDEIGRGTSTYDGMSIARSVLEYIAVNIKAKTLFSTHYHELTSLEEELSPVKNYTMAVKEKGQEIIFLRQLVPGQTDKSYGLNVARLAGMPLPVLARAGEVLAGLEAAATVTPGHQLTLLPYVPSSPGNRVAEELLTELKEIDINRLTPLESLRILYELQQKALGEEGGDPK
ncbi:MAG: DNA mismatch repair protein MutS [Firmicutes bacterium]|nr:DNA mismatch repair protein MutS [Bacillota bacterium]